VDFSNTILSLIPGRRKTTPSGWISFDAVCCHHRGQAADTRSRGGILTTSESGFQYHCFNCGFKAGWSPGRLLSANTKRLCQWLGMSADDISKLNFELMRQQQNTSPVLKSLANFTLEDRDLPEDTRTLKEWAQSDLEESVVKMFEYLITRGMHIDWYPWMWSPADGYRDRLIIPFYHEKRTVGFTARKITPGKPKYLNVSQPGYVFNIDSQTANYDRKYCIVVEGQFDAIAVDGVAIMTNEVNKNQAARITALNRDTIVVPDRDAAGAAMIRSALDNNWSVSMPPWEPHIKDVADAVCQYGRLYTMATILHYRETNPIKIQLLHKKLSNAN